MTASRRKNLPTSSFGVPSKAHGKAKSQSGNYPIDTPGRARDALAYGKRYLSPSQFAALKGRVKRKYPKMNVK